MNDRAVIEPAEIKGSRLPELIALASEESSEKRRLLLRELTAHFFGAPAPNANETALYGTVLAKWWLPKSKRRPRYWRSSG